MLFSLNWQVIKKNYSYSAQHSSRPCFFGKTGNIVVTTEFEQVYSGQVLQPMHPCELTEKERLEALQ